MIAKTQKEKPLTAYARIVKNATEGRGVLLTADEVFDMSTDNAVELVGVTDLEAAGWVLDDGPTARWRKRQASTDSAVDIPSSPRSKTRISWL